MSTELHGWRVLGIALFGILVPSVLFLVTDVRCSTEQPNVFQNVPAEISFPSEFFPSHSAASDGNGVYEVQVDGFPDRESVPFWPMDNAESTESIEEAIGWLNTRPCCISMGIDRHDCFFRLVENSISHLTKYKDQKGHWENIGGETVSDIGCASWGPAHLFVYYVAANHTLVARSFVDEAWTNWEMLPIAQMAEIPDCQILKPGVMHCIGRTIQNLPAAVRAKNGVWKTKNVPRQLLNSAVSCVLNPQRGIDCFAMGINLEMKHVNWKPHTGWNPWKSLGGTSSGTPCPVVTETNHMTVFVNSSLGRLSYTSRKEEKWTKWSLFSLWGPPLATDAECVPSIGARIDCFVGFKPDGRLHRASWNGRQWSRWMVYNYNLNDKPLCRYFLDKKIRCLLLANPVKWTLSVFELIDMPV